MERKMVAFIKPLKKEDWNGEHGMFNGYVAISPEHPLHGVSLNDNRMGCIKIHGGVTFSEYAVYGSYRCGMRDSVFGKVKNDMVGKWCAPIEDGQAIIGDMEDIKQSWFVIGFDTYHRGDTEYNWNTGACVKETLNLYEQLKNMMA